MPNMWLCVDVLSLLVVRDASASLGTKCAMSAADRTDAASWLDNCRSDIGRDDSSTSLGANCAAEPAGADCADHGTTNCGRAGCGNADCGRAGRGFASCGCAAEAWTAEAWTAGCASSSEAWACFRVCSATTTTRSHVGSDARESTSARKATRNDVCCGSETCSHCRFGAKAARALRRQADGSWHWRTKTSFRTWHRRSWFRQASRS